VTIRRLAAAAAAALALGGAGCDHGTAPECQADTDCATGQRCQVAAGVCVGFGSPLLPAPDAGPRDGGDAGAAMVDAGADGAG
jgi:hypothetical protein